MIELLVVIAIIGILAVAVLAAINPIEQINKGNDTGVRSDTGELLNAIDRFYASQLFYPWQTAQGQTTGVAWIAVGSVTDGTTLMLTKLLNSQEVTSTFEDRMSGRSVMVQFTAATSGPTHACFVPSSRAFQLEAKTRCGTADNGQFGLNPPAYGTICPAATCTGTDNPTGCYICLP